MHYFRSVRLHKEAFGAIVQTNVESITENIGDVVSSKPIELQQSPSPALLKEIMKLEAFKDIKQHTVSTTVTESQLTIKYLKDVSTVLAVVFGVRENDLDHINYARHNICQQVYLNDLLRNGKKSIVKGLITNRYNASSSRCWFSTIHCVLATQYLNEETKEMLAHFAQAPSYIHTVKAQP